MKTKVESISDPEYWKKFGVFGKRWEKWLIDHWYIPLAAPYLFIKLLRWINFNAGCYSSYVNYISGGNPKFDFVYISVAITLVICMLLFQNWQKKVPDVFETFLPGRVINNGRKASVKYSVFVQQYKYFLKDRKRYLLIGSLTAVLVIVVSLRYFLSLLHEPWMPSLPCRTVLKILTMVWSFFPLIWAYLACASVWAIISTSRYIKRFVELFDIKVEPFNFDNAGGLNLIGEFCFSMISPLILVTIFCGLFVYIFLRVGYDFNFNQAIEHDPVFGGLLIVFIIAIPLNFIAYFSPMMNMHKEMARQKKIIEDNTSTQIAELEQKTRDLIRRGKLAEAKKSKDAMDLLLSLKPDSYPTWPFARVTLIKFLTTQIPSIVIFITSGVELISKAQDLLGNSGG